MQTDPKPRRVRVEKGIYRSSSGNLEVALTDNGGKLYWKTVGPSIKEARAVREASRVDRERGKGYVHTSLTLTDVATEYLAHLLARVEAGERQQSTYDSTKRNLDNHVLPLLGSKKVGDVNANSVRHLIDALRKKGLAGGTNQLVTLALDGVLTYAKRKNYVAANPCRDVESDERPSRGPLKEGVALSESELCDVIKNANEKWRLVILVAAFSGLRQSELLGLRWSDIDFERGLICVRGQVTREGVWKPTAKTSHGHRSVILADELVQPLAKKSLEDNASPDAFVFSREGGLPLRQREAVRVFMVATKNSYLTGVTWHHLRHTFASHLLDQGFDILFVSKQLGHSSADVTWKVYGHLVKEEAKLEKARGSFAGFSGAVAAAG